MRDPRLAIAMIACCAMGWTASAQFTAGDVIVADIGPGLWRIEPNTTLSSIPIRVSPPFVPHDVAAHPTQTDVMFTFSGFAGGNGFGWIDAPGSTYIARSSSSNPRWIVDVTGHGQTVLAPIGGGVVESLDAIRTSTTIATVPEDIRGAAVDVLTGDILVVDGATRSVVRIDYATGARSRVAGGLPSLPSVNGPIVGMHFDPTTSAMFVCYASGIYRVGQAAGSYTTLLRGAPFTAIGNPDYEPQSGILLVPNAATPAAVFGVDPRTATVTTVRAFPPTALPAAVAASASRQLAARGTIIPGGAIGLDLTVLTDPGATYVIALSFGHGPGIPIGGSRRVYLVPDGLFRLSLLNAGLFANLQGVLDASGRALGTVQIPALPGLRGVRLFAAAVTIVGATPSTVTETIGITIR